MDKIFEGIGRLLELFDEAKQGWRGSQASFWTKLVVLLVWPLLSLFFAALNLVWRQKIVDMADQAVARQFLPVGLFAHNVGEPEMLRLTPEQRDFCQKYRIHGLIFWTEIRCGRGGGKVVNVQLTMEAKKLFGLNESQKTSRWQFLVWPG